MSLAAEALRYRVGSRILLDDVSLTLEPGQIHAVLGPNGAGKSTLLKLLAGDLRGDQGVVRLAGRPLQDWPRQQLARYRAVLPQASDLAFDFTARQVVALGRTPCLRQTPAREAEIIDAALATVDAGHLQSRSYLTLSGGERARVQLARVLAQIWQPVGERYLLLDEPTASLDLAHQHACLHVARRFAADGAGVLVVLHDPNLALAYADQVSLLCCGQLLAQGTPTETLNQANLEKVYGVRIEILQTGDARQTLIAVRP